jgi:hypothetical protein
MLTANDDFTPDAIVKLAAEQAASRDSLDTLADDPECVGITVESERTSPASAILGKNRSVSTLSATSTLLGSTTTTVRHSSDGLGFYTPAVVDDEAMGDVSQSSEPFIIAREFRRSIPLRTVMAYGTQHKRVFTGAEAVRVLLDRLPNIINHDVAIEDALVWGRRLLCDRIFVPIVLSDDAITFGNDSTLFRLTRDALLLEECSAKFFSEFANRLCGDRTGVQLMQGKLLMRTIRSDEKIVSQASLNAWLMRELDISAEEIPLLIRVLIKRRVFDKVALAPAYRFL